MSGPERAYKANGIVLRGRTLGEADRIFTLFTREFGKVDAVAKGIRRAKSSLAGRLEFANEVALGMHRGRSLDVIVNAQTTRAHWPAIVAPGAFATAHLCVELVDAFCELELPMPEVYDLLAGLLAALAMAREPAALVPRFSLRLLDALGVGPIAEACVGCEVSLGGRAAWADIEAGGLACATCRAHRADGYALDAADVASFRALGAPRGTGARPSLAATPAAIRAADAFVTWHLGRRTRASKLLDELSHA